MVTGCRKKNVSNILDNTVKVIEKSEDKEMSEREEELLKRIAALEIENERLKQDMEDLGKKKASVSLRNRFREEHPWMLKMGQDMQDSLSKLVRGVCFPKTEKTRSYTYRSGVVKKMNADYILSSKDMNEEQANLYYEVCGKILGILSEYEVVSEEWKKKYGMDI